MHALEVMIPIVAIVCSLGFAAFAVWAGSRTKQKRWEALSSVQNRMLDKFGTAQEFVEFLKTPEGRSYMMVAVDKGGDSQPAKILGTIKWGIVTLTLGAAFLVLAATFDDDLVVPGAILLSIGIGLIANGIIAVRLARSWGLMKGHGEGENTGIE
jgi:hypothetical protein